MKDGGYMTGRNTVRRKSHMKQIIRLKYNLIVTFRSTSTNYNIRGSYDTYADHACQRAM